MRGRRKTTHFPGRSPASRMRALALSADYADYTDSKTLVSRIPLLAGGFGGTDGQPSISDIDKPRATARPFDFMQHSPCSEIFGVRRPVAAFFRYVANFPPWILH